MGIREDMHAMMNGNFTEEVMSDEDKAALEEREKNLDNSQQNDNNENSNQSNDNSDSQEQVKPNEIGNEIVGKTSEGEVDKTIGSQGTHGEDTTAKIVDGVNAGTKDDGVAQSQENADGSKASEAGDAQLGEVDNKQSEQQKNESGEQTSELDYKQKYEELMKEHESAKAFRDTVTADFKANGKMVKGIDDADKIVKNLQMSTGLTKKLSEYKQAKPFIDPLAKRGFMQNPDKFDVHMQMEDGNIDAVKQFLKNKGIDPIDLDTDDEFKYQAESTRMSPEEQMFGDMQEVADGYGVNEKFTTTVLNDWDPQSMGRLFDGDKGKMMAGQLAEQMANGVYDKVSAISENMKITQPGFIGMSSIDQYNKASEVYNQGLQQPVVKEPVVVAPVKTEAELRAEIRAEIDAENKAKNDSAQAKLESDYKQKMEAERAIEEQRLNAASFSQDRQTSNTAPSTEPTTYAEKQANWNRMMRL